MPRPGENAGSLGGDEKRHLSGILQQLANLILDHTVGIGHPFAQMPEFKPGIDEKGLDEAPGLGRVLKQAPGERPIAFALIAEFVEGLQEFSAILRLDAIFDRHQNGSFIVFDLFRHDGNAPMQGGGKVDLRGGLQFPAPRQGNGERGADRGGKMRDLQALEAGDLPHAALPTVIAPKITVNRMASPRARTQSGKATWAET